MATTQQFDKLSFDFEPDERLLDEKFVKKVAEAAEQEGVTRADVAREFDIPQHYVSKAIAINEGGLIAFRTENELVKNIVKARQKDNQSWGNICGRLGNMGGTRVRNLYEQGADEPYFEHDIGLGGRPRENGEVKTKTKAKAKSKSKAKASDKDDKPKSKSKKSSSKKKGGSKKKSSKKKSEPKTTAPEFGDEPTQEEVAAAIEGKTVTVKKGKSTTDIEVAEVKAVKQAKSGRWGAKVTTTDDSQKTFPLDAITNVA